MHTSVKLSLAGAFKVDLFSGGKFVSTTDWFNNFITDTGLHYPKTYPFVDCFRFLSIGYGNAQNKSNHLGAIATTGLEHPFNTFQTNQGVQSGAYIDWRGYEVGGGGQSSACGTTLTLNGPRFFRAWNVPTGDSSVVVQEAGGALNISEFMVSPGDDRDSIGKFAFSRIRRSLSIPNGYKALVSYQLKIVLNTGATSFGLNTFNKTNADITDDPTSFVDSWYNLNGKYRQVYHGFRCIDDKGASFIPKYGDLMEPSATNLANLTFYLSPDNSQFEVNNVQGGNADSSTDPEKQAYNTDGLMKFLSYQQIADATYSRTLDNTAQEVLSGLYYSPTSADLNINTFPSDVTASNIRLGGATVLNAPNMADYTQDVTWVNSSFNYQVAQADAFSETISFATPGYQQYEDLGGSIKPPQKAVFSSRFIRNTLSAVDIASETIRGPSVSRKSTFTPISSLGYNTRFASLVLAYCGNSELSLGQRTYYPYLDCLFQDSSGQGRLQHYRWISGIVLTERGHGVCNAAFSIVDGFGATGNNINRIKRLQTFQGGYTGSNYETNTWTDSYPLYRLTGWADINPTGAKSCEGNINANILTINGQGYGWGAVLGFYGPNYTLEPFDNPQLPFDCGLYTRSAIASSVPSHLTTCSSGLINGLSPADLFWPHTGATNSKLYLRCDYVDFSGLGITSKLFGWEGKNLTTVAASGFACPTGYIVHKEFLTVADTASFDSFKSRLLPHGAFPTNVIPADNTYSRETLAQGGLYPALGYDNGIEMTLSFSWSSPCGDATDCVELV